ncbi:hypothetical protein SPHI_05450 [Sphingomonas jeddahensis]|uniref:Antitoxin Xre/MbcA/ParS-like toxin-binding domain-containing protein n=1 Tax=Sphingomonas jeddahensis TaxID=1915074 RepID=A0A1V2EXU3_9SPHN|nr:hypothetical protein SPHI_05450 [Sphingomonas jeddahensis]
MNVGPEEASAASSEKPRRFFRAARTACSLTREETAREGWIVRLALDRLGVSGALTFLNTSDPVLGGRPIQLATASREGADAMERAILALG